MQQISQSKIEAHCLSGPFFATDRAMARIADEEDLVLAWFNQRGNVRSVGDDVVIPGHGLRANFWFDETKPNGECFGVTIYTKSDDPERPGRSQSEKLQSDHDYEHPEWPRAKWREAVAADETLQGYWPWVAHRVGELQEA